MRTPAPTACAEAFYPFVGAGHWPARPGMGRSWAGRPSVPPLRTSSASLRSAPSLSSLAFGHLPLIRGESAPKGEGLRAADSRPYKGNQNLIPHPSRATARVAPTAYPAPGALVRQSQAQNWNRTDCNFCKLRAQWPGLNCGKPLRFCAPEGFCPAQGATPVMGVRGKATMSTKCSSGAVPGGVLVTLPPRAKSLAPQGETLQDGAPGRRALRGNEICPLIRLAFGQPPSPQGEGLWRKGGETSLRETLTFSSDTPE